MQSVFIYAHYWQIQKLVEEVGSSQISQCQRDNMRNSLKSLKKEMDDLEKQRKTAVIAEVGRL